MYTLAECQQNLGLLSILLGVSVGGLAIMGFSFFTILLSTGLFDRRSRRDAENFSQYKCHKNDKHE